ncbi:protein kinase kinase kinase [Perkinsus olseni]|uniref:Protein kinase kinase kinase n=1 Tax=Perkinsus olseni TaxID=32597 RepID=A0A7J6PBS3_PEROL|nr:protein kinase kinase kinase [Perkinsus olseni]
MSVSNSNNDDGSEWDGWELDPQEIKIQYRCGSGVTAEVYRGLWHDSVVAVKQIKLGGKRTAKLIQAFKRELSIMVKCRHPNLVLFMGAVTKEEEPIKDIGKGITYLHAFNIVHRDLKSLNLLLYQRVDDEHDIPIVKIADFGMAKIKQDANEDMTANAGTYHWMAPEVLGGNQYCEKVDIYSYGIVMYETLCRAIPYEETGLEAMKIVLAVTRGRRPDLSRYPYDDHGDGDGDAMIHKDLIDIMTQCWEHVPDSRPSMQEVVHRLKALNIQ